MSLNTRVFKVMSGFTTYVLSRWELMYSHKTMNDLISLLICLFFLFQLEKVNEISLETAVSSLSADTI